MRGEYKSNDKIIYGGWGSPPLARGIQPLKEYRPIVHGITPACAGNTFQDRAHGFSKRDHPRLRGEYLSHSFSGRTLAGSPPLARGIQFKTNISTKHFRITPACAGNTKRSFSLWWLNRDHPRLRGEYWKLSEHLFVTMGSPPLARGIRRLCTR